MSSLPPRRESEERTTQRARLQVQLRTRVAHSDAHYAGELVDGAYCLALFGDAATELLIRNDGHEGLFRAYDSVEFLAPVYAGDFLEVTAILEAVGNTSRRIVFEAHKTIELVRDGSKPAGSAKVLNPPVVVCKAVGVCVVPKKA